MVHHFSHRYLCENFGLTFLICFHKVTAAKAPAEGAVCALIRAASSDCARQLLPSLVSRMGREPLPAALPHALLQRLALHHLVDLIFDPTMIGVSR